MMTEGIRVVADKIRNPKRGVCMNKMHEADFQALASTVRWYYNWSPIPQGVSSAGLQFIPMIWGANSFNKGILGLSLKAMKTKPPVVFALNEPNLKGQAYLTPWHTADQYRKIRAITDEFGIPLVGPHVALGSAENASISAFDPVEQKILTYTFMIPFVRAVFFYLKEWGITPPAVGVHTYGGAGELRWAVELLQAEFGCPVWVTEFANWQCEDIEQARDFLLEAVDYLENSQIVAGYAWFKDRVAGKPCISLLRDDPGELSIMGEAYVSAPTHDEADHR